MATAVKQTTVAYGLSLTSEEADFLKSLTQNALTQETADQTQLRQGIFNALSSAAISVS